MTKRIIMTKGLPASGKSYWCVEQIKKQPGRYKHITKDMLREMLDGGDFRKDTEQYIIEARNALILLSLRQGFHVLVDDTNFNPIHEHTIHELVKDQGQRVEIVWQDFTDVPLEVCIERDRIRPNSLGERAIRKMWREYLYTPPMAPCYDETLQDCIIVDLDGTLAHFEGRSPYDTARCFGDKVDKELPGLIEYYRGQGCAVIITTGRREQFRSLTTEWLATQGIHWSAMHMRADDDQRKDSIIKEEMYEQYIAGRFNVRLVYDDREQCVQLWRRLGLVVHVVADGYF